VERLATEWRRVIELLGLKVPATILRGSDLTGENIAGLVYAHEIASAVRSHLDCSLGIVYSDDLSEQSV
jgi:hypothetical protein